MNTRIRKSLRDLGLNRPRTMLLVASVAVGVAAAGGVLGAFDVIDREIDASFASTQPPDAVLTLEGDARPWVDAALEVPGVVAAEARAEVLARISDQPGWQRLTLVAVDDFADVGVASFFTDSGAAAPARGEVLVERASLTEVDLAVGDPLAVSAPGQPARDLTVVGLAHDPGRTPAWMFGNVVAYVTGQTLVDLGYADALPSLLIRGDGAGSREANRVLADDVATHLQSAGQTVTSIQTPVPGDHPASGVMATLLYLLQGFGLITLIASVALVVTLIATQMTQERRQIALMKTSGATSRQIGSIYITSALLVSAAGLIVGIPLGLGLTRGLSTFAFTLLNLDARSYLPASWIILAQAAVALLIPVVAVAVPVWRRSRVSVRSGLDGPGTGRAARARPSRIAPRWGRPADLGVRNAWRDRGRLVLNAVALGLGVAAFIAALNTGAAWDRAVDREFASQHFDVDVRLATPTPQAQIDDATRNVPGIDGVESWAVTRAAATDLEDAQAAPGTSFLLMAPPAGATAVTYPVVEGRWLEPGDRHALVISQNLTDPVLMVGSRVTLDGDDSTWTVVGVVVQLAGDPDGVAYASDRPDFMPAPGLVNAIRVSGATTDQALQGAEVAFSDAGIPVAAAVTADDARQSLDDHLLIITGLLLAMAALMGIVGVLGLVESIGTAVLARRREIGVAQAVGASSRQTVLMVLSEALVIAAIGWAVGALMSWPLTAVIQAAVGNIFIGAPLPFTVFVPGIAISLAAVSAIAAVSSAVPALEAADRPVHESLAHA